MADYKKMYLTLVNKVEDVIKTLNDVKNECEDIYIDTDTSSEE